MPNHPANEDETDESTPRFSRRRALQLGILSATTGLAGCGGDGDDTDDTDDTDEPTDTEEEMSETESVVTDTDMDGTETDMNGTATDTETETDTETDTDTETETETETDTTTPTPSEPTQELRLHWPLDSDATDASGNGYDAAKIEGSPTYGADGKVGSGSVELTPDEDGEDDFIGITTEDYDDFEVDTSDFTVAWWHYPRSAVNFNQRVGTHGVETNWTQWQFNAKNGGGITVGFDFENGDRFDTGEGSGTLELDTWQHIAFTYDGTDAVLYLNGSVALGPTIMNNRDPITRFVLAGIDGRVDDVRIYGGALSAGEVKYLFNLGE